MPACVVRGLCLNIARSQNFTETEKPEIIPGPPYRRGSAGGRRPEIHEIINKNNAVQFEMIPAACFHQAFSVPEMKFCLSRVCSAATPAVSLAVRGNVSGYQVR